MTKPSWEGWSWLDWGQPFPSGAAHHWEVLMPTSLNTQ